jgi:DNA-binding GntR family transcriptional regulator
MSTNEASGSPLARIEPRYLRDEATARLRDAIVSGALVPGTPLVIDEVAALFGLSTMPVREAVRRLVSEGLVEEMPRRRHRVAPLDRRRALDVLEISETLIVRAYELGLPRLDGTGIARMRAALEEAAGAAADGDLDAAQRSIHAFHGIAYEATGNPEFARLIAIVVPRFDRVLRQWYSESVTGVATSYRRDMLEALERGEVGEALEIVRRAWRSFRDIVAAHE